MLETTSAKPRVFLIDSSIYIFRAWFTMPDTLVNADNQPVNALYGFADFLINLLEKEKPTHIACAFDQSLTHCWRSEIYPAYKANREPAPEDLKAQFKFCRELVRAAGIAEFGSHRFEADDIIGTLSHTMRGHGFRNMIVTGDKDLAQLIHKDDYWWEYARDYRMDMKGIFKKFGVMPDQMADMLALAGDAVDNIPGIPGVGPKTAANLLAKFKTLDILLDNIHNISEMKFRGAKRIQTLLEEHHESARLSQKLTLIAHDDSLPKDHAALSRKPYDAGALDDIFEQIGFGNLRRKRWHTVLSS